MVKATKSSKKNDVKKNNNKLTFRDSCVISYEVFPLSKKIIMKENLM